MKNYIYGCLFIIALICSPGHLMSQDNSSYEFVTIFYQAVGQKGTMSISSNGNQFELLEIRLSGDEKRSLNTNQLQRKVTEYTQKGWEVVTFTFSVTSSGLIHYACLKRKKD
jgi:hypothetical protein